MEAALRALAEPRRREILRLVRDVELPAGLIAAHFDVSRPAVSQHLTVLKQAGLVVERRQGTSRLYRARPEGLAELRGFLDSFWDTSLERLKVEAELEQRRALMAQIQEASQPIVEREVRIAASPEMIFGFFTDPRQMERWMGQRATLEPHPGGRYHVALNDRHVASGQYLEIVPYSRIVFSFGWEGEGHPIPPGSTTVEVLFVAAGDETLVRLSHRGLPADAVADHTSGWDHYIARLAIAATGGDPGPDPNAACDPSDQQPASES